MRCDLAPSAGSVEAQSGLSLNRCRLAENGFRRTSAGIPLSIPSLVFSEGLGLSTAVAGPVQTEESLGGERPSVSRSSRPMQCDSGELSARGTYKCRARE